MRKLFWTIGFALLTSGAIAQTNVRAKFEVASIKLSGPDVNGSWYEFPAGGRFNIVNKTLKGMIEFAWGMQPFQISDGPPWLDSIHYDISAKSEISPKMDEIPPMLQALLTDRFQLAIHHETKELPIYALVVAKKGKLGPGLTESKEGSCTSFDPSSKSPSRPEAGATPRRECGSMTQNPRGLGAIAVPIAKLVSMLSATLGRTVVDKTGLTGNFDIHLQWTPDETQAFQFPPDAKVPPSDPAGPSLFSAIQEQLGLKLESSRGPVDVLIVDRAEKPSENRR